MKQLPLLLTTLFLFSFLQLHTQEWAPIGAEWRYRSELSPTNEVWYELIRIEKDTTIAGYDCRKYVVYKEALNLETPIFKYIGFTFERNDSVFFWHENDFYLRYDFSALPGDTILVPTPGFGHEPGTTDSFIVILDSIKTELIGLSQTPLQKYYTHSIAGTLDYFDNGYYRIIGSQSVWGDLTTDGIPLGLIYDDLRCYKDDNIDIFGIDLNCGFPTIVNERLEQPSIRLYPNPTSDFLNVFFSERNFRKWSCEIFNNSGKRMSTVKLHPTSSFFLIKVQEWPPGQYFLLIRDEKRRFIISHSWIKL